MGAIILSEKVGVNCALQGRWQGVAAAHITNHVSDVRVSESVLPAATKQFPQDWKKGVYSSCLAVKESVNHTEGSC